MKRLRAVCMILTTAAEIFVLAEAWYYFTHEETLHGAIADAWDSFCARAETRVEAERTARMIQELPETE